MKEAVSLLRSFASPALRGLLNAYRRSDMIE